MRYLRIPVAQFDFRWAAKQARDAVISRCIVHSFAPARGGVGAGARIAADHRARLVRPRICPVTGAYGEHMTDQKYSIRDYRAQILRFDRTSPFARRGGLGPFQSSGAAPNFWKTAEIQGYHEQG
jgi:hypothetical protein